MCDSFVALGNSTKGGSVLLAKSADTEVNEAEHVVRYPAREYRDGALVRITHRTIPQAKTTHAVILGRSFWAWGAELGCNEHGVAVGNEAAFSNQKAEADGTCCLDLLRIAVERGETPQVRCPAYRAPRARAPCPACPAFEPGQPCRTASS